MRGYKQEALHNFDDWRCQSCNADLWLVEREPSGEAHRDFCCPECAQTIPLSGPLIVALKKVIDSGQYFVPAWELADAMLDGIPFKTGVGLRSYQWRQRRITELKALL